MGEEILIMYPNGYDEIIRTVTGEEIIREFRDDEPPPTIRTGYSTH